MPPAPPGVVGFLTEEHAELESLFEEVESCRGGLAGVPYTRLRADLLRHEVAEEMVVFPYLRPLARCDGALATCIAGQAEMEEQLAVIEKLEVGSRDFHSALHELGGLVRRHIAVEEEQLLPALAEASSEEKVTLGGAVHVRQASGAEPSPPAPAGHAAGQPDRPTDRLARRRDPRHRVRTVVIRDQIEVMVEIPGGSRNKYELDNEGHVFRLSRQLPPSLVYPGDYGFVLGTESSDGDPLDVLVLIDEPTFPGCCLTVVPLGVVWMEDEEGRDPKIVAVLPERAEREGLADLSDLPEIVRESIEQFFSIYKELEPDGATPAPADRRAVRRHAPRSWLRWRLVSRRPGNSGVPRRTANAGACPSIKRKRGRSNAQLLQLVGPLRLPPGGPDRGRLTSLPLARARRDAGRLGRARHSPLAAAGRRDQPPHPLSFAVSWLGSPAFTTLPTVEPPLEPPRGVSISRGRRTLRLRGAGAVRRPSKR
jgi:inorganic pyrophosphatase